MIILASGKPWQHPSRQSGTEWHLIASVIHFSSYVTNRHKKTISVVLSIYKRRIIKWRT